MFVSSNGSRELTGRLFYMGRPSRLRTNGYLDMFLTVGPKILLMVDRSDPTFNTGHPLAGTYI